MKNFIINTALVESKLEFNKGFRAIKLFLYFVVFSSMQISMANAMEAPEDVVKKTVNEIVNKIQSNRATYQSNTNALYQMVENTLVPAIHVDRMSGLILGKSFKVATPKQKSDFSAEFQTFLIRSYATALLDYTGNQKVNYLPVNAGAKADKVKIMAELIAGDGQKYAINLFMSNRGDTKWRAYNVEVGGINFVSTYRANFGAVIAQKGIDGLIADLKQKNAKLGS